MRVIGLNILDDFRHRHTDAEEQVKAWIAEVKEAEWSTPLEVKQRYPRASVLEDNRMVFRLKGNHYRLVAKVSYKNQIVRVERVGTHAEYDKWNL